MKLKSTYILACAIIVIAFASCKKDLIKTNTDPNAVSVDAFDPNNILTSTQLYYTGSSYNAQEVEETEIAGAGCFIQHYASTSGLFFGDKYLLSTGGFGYFYDNVYTEAVKYAVDLYTTTQGKSQYSNLHQISRIMKAMIFQRVTDVYGDIPYFQAGKGYHESVFFPAYDKQQDIYADMLKEVSQAVDSLNDKGDQPIGDLMYGGRADQIEAWKRFGNSFLLRLAMRLVKVDPATAQKYATQVQGKTLGSNADNAIIMHDNNDPLSVNRIYRGIGEDGDVQLSWQLSNTFVDFLKNNNDPRLPVLSYVYPADFDPLGTPPANDPSGGSSLAADQHGLPNGYDAGNTVQYGIVNYRDPITQKLAYLGSIPAYSRPSPIVFYKTAPTLVLTYAETELLLAEAAQRWGLGDAAAHYENGVESGITELSAFNTPNSSAATIAQSDAAAYYKAHSYVAANGLEMINDQYWVTTFFDEYEAWSNFRRTEMPTFVRAPRAYPGSLSPGAIPRRMEYSVADKQINPNNYKAAVARLQGGDKITSRVWWDVATPTTLP